MRVLEGGLGPPRCDHMRWYRVRLFIVGLANGVLVERVGVVEVADGCSGVVGAAGAPGGWLERGEGAPQSVVTMGAVAVVVVVVVAVVGGANGFGFFGSCLCQQMDSCSDPWCSAGVG